MVSNMEQLKTIVVFSFVKNGRFSRFSPFAMCPSKKVKIYI